MIFVIGHLDRRVSVKSLRFAGMVLRRKQEDKEGMFDTVETITVAIDILAGMLNTTNRTLAVSTYLLYMTLFTWPRAVSITWLGVEYEYFTTYPTISLVSSE